MLFLHWDHSTFFFFFFFFGMSHFNLTNCQFRQLQCPRSHFQWCSTVKAGLKQISWLHFKDLPLDYGIADETLVLLRDTHLPPNTSAFFFISTPIFCEWYGYRGWYSMEVVELIIELNSVAVSTNISVKWLYRAICIRRYVSVVFNTFWILPLKHKEWD